MVTYYYLYCNLPKIDTLFLNYSLKSTPIYGLLCCRYVKKGDCKACIICWYQHDMTSGIPESLKYLHVCVGRGEGEAKRKAQAQILNMLQSWQSDLSPSQSQWERKVRNKKKEMTVTQGGTRTHDLANGLPCSNQLSYWVTRQLSGWVRVLKAELPGIQLKIITHDRISGG